jgi:hypothetical protein
MKGTDPPVLIGNALSSMVAATELANSDHPIVVVNGTNNWGGHFTTLEFDGIAYDAGMVLHEFTSFGAQGNIENISTYDPSIRNDTGRFCKTIADYVGRFQKTHAVCGIKMYVDGRCYDDFLIANKLTSLNEMPFAGEVLTELLPLAAKGASTDLHASKKHSSAGFNGRAFEPVSLANHGPTLHAKLFEPYCRKLLNIGTADVVALYHRVAWLPLFYPETLLSYLQRSPQTLPPTVFDYPDVGCIGDVAARLKTGLLQCPNVRVLRKFPTRLRFTPDRKYEISFDDQTAIKTERLAWSGNLTDLLKLAGAPEKVRPYDKASFTLVFAKVLAYRLTDDFSVLSVSDPAFVIHRVTNQTRCNGDITAEYHRLVIEINFDCRLERRLVANPEDLHQWVAKELVMMGLIDDPTSLDIVKVVDLKNALPLPNKKNVDAFEDELAAVRAIFPTVSLSAGSCGFSSSSFNHQVLQGLKLARTWSI